MKNFCSVKDVENIEVLLNAARHYKQQPLQDKDLGKGKRAGLLFLNPSLRTRLSTQVAAMNLGLEPVVINVDKEGWSLEFEPGAVMDGHTVEHIKDAAPVLGNYFDLLCIRAFPGLKNRESDYSEQVLQGFLRYSGIPVISMESATLHPLQSLADLITISERLPIRRPKIVLSWAPHIKPLPQAVSNSFAQWVTAWGKADFVITHPKGMELHPSFITGATISYDQEVALTGADFIYVKNWSGYTDYGKLPEAADHWILNEQKLKTAVEAKVMHCLPVRRNVELSDELLDGPRSLVTEQAANRVWAAQAVLAEILRTMNTQATWKN